MTLVEITRSHRREAAQQRSPRRFKWHLQLFEDCRGALRIFSGILKGVESQQDLSHFQMTVANQLCTTHFGQPVEGLEVARQSAVVVAAQELQISYAKPGLPGLEQPAGLLKMAGRT